MESKLNGKTAIITGGTSGVGRATAILLAEKGMKALVIGRTKEKLEEMEKQNPGKIFGAAADTGDYNSLEQAFLKADELLGKIDVFINNASLPARSILNTSPDEWQEVTQTNLVGYMNGFKLAIERMQEQGNGHIVAMGSLCTNLYEAEADVYVATKTGAHGLAVSLRKLVAGMGIKVTEIVSGSVGTGMVSETKEQQQALFAQGHMLKDTDIAQAILFALEQPPQVDITEIEIRPHRQSEL